MDQLPAKQARMAERCLCDICRLSTTPDGKPGCMLDKRTHTRHNKSQRNIDAVAKASSQNSVAAIARHDTQVTETVDKLSATSAHRTEIPGTPQPTTTSRNYSIDRKKAMVAKAGDIEKTISTMKVRILEVGRAPIRPDDARIAKSLQTLETIERDLGTQTLELNDTIRNVKGTSVTQVHADVTAALTNIKAFLADVKNSWVQARHVRISERSKCAGAIYDTSKHFQPLLARVEPFIQLILLMIVACHVVLRLPQRGTLWLFLMCRTIIETVVHKILEIKLLNAILPQTFSKILQGFPRDVRAALVAFDLEPQSLVYAACSKCHTTYKPTICKELLVRPQTVGKSGTKILVPIHQYLVFDFKDWFSGLLSRNGYEDTMDGAWARMKIPPNGQLTDIFQGSTI
ncbi:hypothetical protein DXG01_016593 [Tephrocybe rancida]|nr:hypothetical protein DXG01_016593 [Tephrocybe rancida]